MRTMITFTAVETSHTEQSDFPPPLCYVACVRVVGLELEQLLEMYMESEFRERMSVYRFAIYRPSFQGKG